MADLPVRITGDISAYVASLQQMAPETAKAAKAAGKSFQTELTGAQKKVGTEATKQAKKSASAWSDAGKRIAAAFAAAGIASIAKSFVGLAQNIADARNELLDASARTGIAAETLNGLKLAAEGSGLAFSNIESVTKRLPRSMLDAAKGIGTSKDAFEQLGVEVVDADGKLRDADSVLRETVSSLNGVEGQTEKAALAMEIFGGRGAQLLQALGGAELEDFTEIANRFGTKVGPEAAAAAANWQREVANLKSVFRGALEEIVPFGTGAAEALQIVSIGVVTTSTLVSESFQVMTDAVKNFGKFWVALLTGDIEAASEAFREANAVAIVGSLGDAIDKAQEAGQEYANYAEKLSGSVPATFAASDATKSFTASVKAAKDEVLESTTAAAMLFEELAELELKVREVNAEDLELFEIDQEIENAQILKAELNAIGEEAAAVDERITQLQQSSAERRLEILEEERKKREEIADAIVAAAEVERSEIEANQALRLEAVSNIATIIGTVFEQSKGAAIAEAVINTAVAVTKALSGSIPPFNAIAAATVAAAGAAEIATISATTFDTGLSFSPAGLPGVTASDRFNATLQQDERVLTARGVRAMGGDSSVRAANRGQSMPSVIKVEQRYKHKGFDSFFQDNIARDATARQAVSAIASSGGRVGHRSRS